MSGGHFLSHSFRGGTMAAALVLLLPLLFPSLFAPFSHALPSVFSVCCVDLCIVYGFFVTFCFSFVYFYEIFASCLAI